MKCHKKIDPFVVFLAVVHNSCGISMNLKAAARSSQSQSQGKLQERELLSQGDSSPMKPDRVRVHAEPQEIATEPSLVGGAFLSCSLLNTAAPEELRAQVSITCNYDPKDNPSAQNAISFAFSQGSSPSSATAVSLHSSETATVDAMGKLNYVFNFSREGLSGPFLYASMSDSSKNPPLRYEAAVDVRARELISLVGPSGAIVGPLAPWPIGSSDVPCGPGPGPEAPTRLNAVFAWKFQIESDAATLKLDLRGLCGVSSRLAGLNAIEIKGDDRDDPVLHKISFEKDTYGFVLRDFVLPKGRYQIITRASRSVPLIGVFDNVFIGRMNLELLDGRIDMGLSDVIESQSSSATQE